MISRSLLLVDADPAVHQRLTALLQREDRSIQDVYDGKEAIAWLRNSPCDVVLAGQGRNGFDNLKLLRRVRAMLPKTRVILAGDAAGKAGGIVGLDDDAAQRRRARRRREAG